MESHAARDNLAGSYLAAHSARRPGIGFAPLAGRCSTDRHSANELDQISQTGAAILARCPRKACGVARMESIVSALVPSGSPFAAAAKVSPVLERIPHRELRPQGTYGLAGGSSVSARALEHPVDVAYALGGRKTRIPLPPDPAAISIPGEWWGGPPGPRGSPWTRYLKHCQTPAASRRGRRARARGARPTVNRSSKARVCWHAASIVPMDNPS